jgi:hypothetical protein
MALESFPALRVAYFHLPSALRALWGKFGALPGLLEKEL